MRILSATPFDFSVDYINIFKLPDGSYELERSPALLVIVTDEGEYDSVFGTVCDGYLIPAPHQSHHVATVLGWKRAKSDVAEMDPNARWYSR